MEIRSQRTPKSPRTVPSFSSDFFGNCNHKLITTSNNQLQLQSPLKMHDQTDSSCLPVMHPALIHKKTLRGGRHKPELSPQTLCHKTKTLSLNTPTNPQASFPRWLRDPKLQYEGTINAYSLAIETKESQGNCQSAKHNVRPEATHRK